MLIYPTKLKQHALESFYLFSFQNKKKNLPKKLPCLQTLSKAVIHSERKELIKVDHFNTNHLQTTITVSHKLNQHASGSSFLVLG